MRTVYTFAAFCLLLCLPCSNVGAQNLADRIREDKNIAAGVYSPYHHGNLHDTPAPKGYKPFYISHYGRHGSRYHTSDKFYINGKKYLKIAKEAGVLNETGLALYRDLLTLDSLNRYMNGELSPLGAREHRAIADRMAKRFSKVFEDKHRNEVDCKSSTVQRCIVSMANFTLSLYAAHPDLEISYDTGKKYLMYIAKDIDNKEVFDECEQWEDSARAARCHYDDFCKLIFKDKDEGIAAIGYPGKLIKSIFLSASICPDLDFSGLDMFKYLTAEEAAEQGILRSDKFYGQFGNSKEWGEYSSAAAKDLLKDIVTKADWAMYESSRRAADLRFGHDTGIMPLMGLMGLKGFEERCPMSTAHEHWSTYDYIPMATNLQMIFYRNKKGDVLVKLLRNEEETSIPALTPVSGPYYDWKTLRAYFVSLCE